MKSYMITVITETTHFQNYTAVSEYKFADFCDSAEHTIHYKYIQISKYIQE